MLARWPTDEPIGGDYGLDSFTTGCLKLAGWLLVGCVVVSAPFVLHAYATRKPGTYWEHRPRRA